MQAHYHTSLTQDAKITTGVQLAKNDFGSVFCSVLQKNCGFLFGFGFTK